MSLLKMYVTDSLYLDAEQTSETTYVIHLSNGKKIDIEEHPEHNGNVWAWKVDKSIFDDDDSALDYLKRLINEKLTGKRIIMHAKWDAPNICGVDGRACRSPGECNTALCSCCPVAEAFFAEQDGVELVYAVF